MRALFFVTENLHISFAVLLNSTTERFKMNEEEQETAYEVVPYDKEVMYD